MTARSTRRARNGTRFRAIAMIVPALLMAAPAAPGVAAPAGSGGADTAQPMDYRLGPGDKIRITVYDETSMTGDYIVSARGTISFPLIGDVPASELGRLAALVERRERERPHGSYTTRLFESGVRRIAQKVGEEGVETALAAVAQDDDALLGEAADLAYHLLVLLRARGLGLADVERVLADRR